SFSISCTFSFIFSVTFSMVISSINIVLCITTPPQLLICPFLHIHIIPFSYQHNNKILCTDNLIEQF
ncbi:MAG: hypothetical protein ACLUOH_06610, partial [Eubacterium sp.]